jgi:hypothetical protein
MPYKEFENSMSVAAGGHCYYRIFYCTKTWHILTVNVLEIPEQMSNFKKTLAKN